MFMRVGGGIFTKAADVGADLVGKVEQNIPEDDPRNAATIADNVGDNVGDCAGMAADLFESYAVTLVAALILGSVAFGTLGLTFPLIIPAIGVLTAIVGVFITRTREGENALRAINRSFYISAIISIIACSFAAFTYLPSSFAELPGVDAERIGDLAAAGNPQVIAAVAVVIGIVLAIVILSLTGYYTRHRDPAGQGRRHELAHGCRDGDPRRHLGRVRVGGLHRARHRRGRVRRIPAVGLRLRRPVRRGPRRHRPADHGRRHRRHGHLRSGLRQRPGHRRDVR